MDIIVRHLYIAPGHNYFGHHGQAASSHPVQEVEIAECVAGQGIRGDRFFGFKKDYKGQITFFAWEVFLELCRHLGVTNVSPGAVRRNIITEGVELNSLIGREFLVQGVRLAGVEQCKPCYWMDSAVKTGAEDWLQGRGGLRARILNDGLIKRDTAA